MGRAKEIIVKVIPAKIANEFVKKYHYSGKVAANSSLHFGCFLDGKLHGVMSYGSSMQKSNIINLVEGTGWNDFLELNRMAFDDYLPKYSESRCISISIKLIKKHAPNIKWIISFADATQCGDGTIYRASGFYLTQINKNKTILQHPNGTIFADIGLRASSNELKKRVNFKKGERFSTYKKRENVRMLEGYQNRYIYLIDKSCKITVPILPFSKIDEMGAGMYKGKKRIQQHAAEVLPVARQASSLEEGFDSTLPLNITTI